MKTSGALLVLLCCYLAETLVRGETTSENDITHQGHSGEAETRENDIHTVLREISALMAEQRMELRHTKTQMGAMETRLRASENKAETRLRASENKAESMETRLRASENKAGTMETRLRASENKVEEQRAVMKELKEKQEEQATAVRAVGGSVRREREERRVSFSASMKSYSMENFGSGEMPGKLIYEYVITNIGYAYSPHTGVFTAPVKGVYFFNVFVYGAGKYKKSTGVSLYKNTGVSPHKNEEQVVIAKSQQPTDSLSTSNGASLLLEKGDEVYVKLCDDSWVRETTERHTTFSGHLLFLM